MKNRLFEKLEEYLDELQTTEPIEICKKVLKACRINEDEVGFIELFFEDINLGNIALPSDNTIEDEFEAKGRLRDKVNVLCYLKLCGKL